MAGETTIARENKVSPVNAISANSRSGSAKFGFPGTTHESAPFGGSEKDEGRVNLPGGGYVSINHTAKGNNPYMKSDIYHVTLVRKNGNTKDYTFTSEREAVSAQQRVYEKEVAKRNRRIRR